MSWRRDKLLARLRDGCKQAQISRGKYAGKYALCAGKRKKRQWIVFRGKKRERERKRERDKEREKRYRYGLTRAAPGYVLDIIT